MKICRFIFEKKITFGVIENEKIFIYENEKISRSFVLRSEITLLPPVEPSKIVCVGRNYAEHAAELGNQVPKEPLLFLKAPSSIIVDGEPIVIPVQSKQVEHEGELAVVIKRDCQNLADSENAFDFVQGYLCLNDVTARDIQRQDVQFTRAKSFDTFCPVSSFMETEFDVSDIALTTKINGAVKQRGQTSQMVFPVDFLIKYISRQMTLKAGDIIATGTPSGVSKMESGDICTIEIEGIGSLSNPVQQSK